eukprot:2974384-Pyramimonas_sp.AAC.2
MVPLTQVRMPAAAASAAAAAGGAGREQLPGFYYHAAATATIASRQASERATAGRDPPPRPAAYTVQAGPHVGTLVAQPYAGANSDPLTAPSPRPLTDAEWADHLLLEQTSAPPSRLANELLTRAHDQFKQVRLRLCHACVTLVSRLRAAQPEGRHNRLTVG